MNEDIFGAFPYYRELAYYIKRLEQYERALMYFDQAIMITPTDQRTLIGRAATRAKNVEYKGAMEDLHTALKNKPDDLIVLAHKALTTYLSCEFEEALIQNLSHLPKRKKPDSFLMGVMHCTEAIENCIGVRAGRPLRDYFKMIRILAWKKAKEDKNPYEIKNKRKRRKPKKKDKLSKAIDRIQRKSKSRSSLIICKSYPVFQYNSDLEICDSLYSHESEKNDIPPGPPYPHRPLQRRTSNIENYMAEKYLDKMYLDKTFLKSFGKRDGVKSANQRGTKNILLMAKEGYKTLDYKQELLRTRRPFYYIKYQEGIISPALKKRLEEALQKTRDNASQIVFNMFEMIKECIERKDTRKVMELAEQLKIYCDARTRNILPHKDNYFEELYNLVGKALVSLKRLNYEQYPWDQEKRIYQMLGYQISREPSTDSVVKQFKDIFIDYKKTIQLIHNRLEEARTLEECMFAYYELCRLYLDLKQYDLARLFGRKCLSEGYRCNNVSWIINAKMLMVRADIQQRNRNDARTALNEVLHIANKMKNKILIDYVEKCLKIVEKCDFDEPFGYKIVEKREKQIIDMIPDDKMKQEIAYLFRKMAALPASRRMSIMPGIRFRDDPSEKKPGGRLLSISATTKEEVEGILERKDSKMKTILDLIED